MTGQSGTGETLASRRPAATVPDMTYSPEAETATPAGGRTAAPTDLYAAVREAQTTLAATHPDLEYLLTADRHEQVVAERVGPDYRHTLAGDTTVALSVSWEDGPSEAQMRALLSATAAPEDLRLYRRLTDAGLALLVLAWVRNTRELPGDHLLGAWEWSRREDSSLSRTDPELKLMLALLTGMVSDLPPAWLLLAVGPDPLRAALDLPAWDVEGLGHEAVQARYHKTQQAPF